MGITQALNSKANVKKLTNQDLPFAPQQPVIASYYATSTASQTVINLTFSVDTTNSDVFWLFVDGKKLDLGTSNDYTFTAIAADGTSSQVTLNQGLPINLNIQAFKLGLKKESEFLMDNRFVQLYAAQNAGFQGFINQATLMTPTTTTGTPAAGTFYSSIPNRASIVDLSQDLQARMGINRIMTQDIQMIANESGGSNEVIWGVPSDVFGQIRFIGAGWVSQNGTFGVGDTFSLTVGDSVEITFYGTGLNILGYASSNVARSSSITVDGVATGTYTQSTTTTSTLIGARGYSSNVPINIATGLTLGIHTVRLTMAVSSLDVFGFEILNESANVIVAPGVSYIQGKKYTTSASSSASYSSPVTGSKGGRVLVYQNGDGSIGRSFQAVDASQNNLTAADHTNEEMVRVYQGREFGSNRADDFSAAINGTAQNLAFVLDDGVTGLNGLQVRMANVTGGDGVFATSGIGNFVTLTFVGTGLDILWFNGTGVTNTYTPTVDGTNLTNISIATTTGPIIQKIVSGLPYGTHTVSFTNTLGAANGASILQFRVYQPKKPTLPSGSVELADYNVMANYVVGTAGTFNTATGVLRKSVSRELFYNGTWSLTQNTSEVGGFNATSSTAGSFFQYTFFGTGLEIRFGSSAAGVNWTASIDGVTNLTGAGYTTSFYGASVTSFTGTTGVLVTNSTSANGNGIRISGLALGTHTVKMAYNSGASNIQFAALDIIVPIHSTKSNILDGRQNTSPVGSQSISDNRKLTPVAGLSPTKAWAQAVGVAASPTTISTTLVPCPDMSVTIKTSGGPLKVHWECDAASSSLGAGVVFQVYVNGMAAGTTVALTQAVANDTQCYSAGFKIPVVPGVHKVDLFWDNSAGTLTATGTRRILLVEET